MARKKGHWKTRDGREIPIIEMTDSHLKASENYLLKKLKELNNIAEANAKINKTFFVPLTLEQAFGAVYYEIKEEVKRRFGTKDATNSFIFSNLEIATEDAPKQRIRGFNPTQIFIDDHPF